MFDRKHEKPRGEVVADLMLARGVGATVTYEDLSDALGYDVTVNRNGVQQARNLMHQHKLSFENVRGVGYRVISGAEHEREFTRRKKRASKQTHRAIREVVAADRSQMDRASADRFDSLEKSMRDINCALRNHETRLKQLETVQRTVRDTNKALTEQNTEMEHRVARLEDALRARGLRSA